MTALLTHQPYYMTVHRVSLTGPAADVRDTHHTEELLGLQAK